MNQTELRNFEAIKDKIETLKSRRAKAEGSMESILSDWKQKYNISSLEEAEKYLHEKQNEKEENEVLMKEYYEELNSLTSWGLL